MASVLNSPSVEAALRERIKELTCLYQIAQIEGTPGISLAGIHQSVVELLPPAWQYPEIASARILVDMKCYATAGFMDSPWKQSAKVVVDNAQRGTVEVVYREERPALDEGPFLKEERSLIDSVAQQVALIIERKEAEEDRLKLQGQLLHADRLATIGLLAAGVAHELNEPLGNILGFAQLAKRDPALSETARGDIGKIESASLHAREVIKNLLMFAREMPPQKTQVDLNRIVEEGFYFFQARCARNGIEPTLLLSPDLPRITADASQMNQIFINLVANALQAMPEGGSLTVQTQSPDHGDSVSLIVEDNGTGISEDAAGRIFTPFFTTKDVGQGTGLGLSVVYGIVSAHGGRIHVESSVGRGTRFEIVLPVGEASVEKGKA